MKSAHSLSSAICSRSCEDSEGSKLRAFREHTEEKPVRTKLVESVSLVERVDNARQLLINMIEHAASRSISDTVRAELEAILKKLT